MDCDKIIEELKAMSSEKFKQNVVKLGIPEQHSIGVSTGELRKIAKELPKSSQLAKELWHTGYHEAKLLAVLLFDKKTVSLKEVSDLMEDVASWDLCDHLCKNLIMKVKQYKTLIFDWCDSDRTYFKRGAFTLVASVVVHEKHVTEEEIQQYLSLIVEHSTDEREHVKKAISWALREIGKRDFACQEKAVLIAHELKSSDNKAQVWIGKDALKELENLVQVDGRGRLISADSKMGKE